MGLLIGEFIDKDLNCIPKVIKVLNYLNQGRELKLGEHIYKLGETTNSGFNLLFKMKSYSSGVSIENAEDKWFGFSGNLINFSEMCNSLTDKEIVEMSANMALQDINTKEREWL